MPEEYKKQQSSRLAQIIPMIMNTINGRDQHIAKVLAGQRQQEDAKMDQANLQAAMTTIMMPETGEITPQLLQQVSEQFKVPGKVLAAEIADFQQARQAMKGPSQQYTELYPDTGMSRIFNMTEGDAKKYAGPEGTELYQGKITMPTQTENKPPKTREIKDGNNIKTQQWNGKTWEDIGTAPRFNDKSARGMSIKTNPDGTTEILTNVSQGNQPTRTTKSKLQSELLSTNATYSDMRSILNSYDDKFLKGKNKIGFMYTALKDKWGSGEISLEEKAELKEYTKWKRGSISTLNNYIKEITGAAMSAQEATRLMKGMPNPGVNLFDGDSPTEFKAKLESVFEQLDRVIARDNYVLKNGLASFKDVGLDNVDGLIDKRGTELENAIKAKNPQMSDEEIENLVIDELSKEFGIQF